MDTTFHFPIMILASIPVFLLLFRIVLPMAVFRTKVITILWLSLPVVVVGMLFGKYGATWGWPWWIYYPVPMLTTLLLPPLVLKLNRPQTLWYIGLSFLSAPFIHASFSLLLGWSEYMPFWKLPHLFH